MTLREKTSKGQDVRPFGWIVAGRSNNRKLSSEWVRCHLIDVELWFALLLF